jgi:hypothetical protein
MDLKNQYCQNVHTTQCILQIQFNPVKISMEFFTEIEKAILTYVWKPSSSLQIARTNLSQKTKAREEFQDGG